MSVIVDLRVDEDDGVPWLVCEDTDGEWLFHTELDGDQMRELYSRVGAWLQSAEQEEVVLMDLGDFLRLCPICGQDHFPHLTPIERATL